MAPEGLALLTALQEAGSISAAAERRHISQPAFTRQIQRLARDVGMPVVARHGRGVALTPAGEALAALARAQDAQWQETLATLRGRPGVPLRVGCGATIALTLLPAALARLRAEAPGLPVRVYAGDSAATASRILAGEMDAGLVTTAPADRRLTSTALLRDPVVAVAPPSTAPRGRSTLAALAARPLCLYARGTGFRAFVDALFAAKGLFPEPVAEVDSLEALRELVAAGLGWSLLPRSVAAGALAGGRLREVQVAGLGGARRTIALVRRADRPAHAALPSLLRALQAAAGALGGPAGA